MKEEKEEEEEEKKKKKKKDGEEKEEKEKEEEKKKEEQEEEGRGGERRRRISGKMQTYRQYQTILQFAHWQVIRRTQASRSWPPVALYRRIMFIAPQHANAYRAPYCYGKSDRLLDRHTLVLYRNKCIVKLCTHLIGA